MRRWIFLRPGLRGMAMLRLPIRWWATVPVDLVYLEGYASHVDMNWESPSFARFLRGLAGHARLIVTDCRGNGCSDRFSPSDIPPIETLVDDLFVVMDAVGSERAVVLATSWLGFVGAQAAAGHPERVAALVLESPLVTFVATEQTPWGVTDEWYDEILEAMRADWGSSRWPGAEAVSQTEREWYQRWQRASHAPGALIALTRSWRHTDFHGVLPSIHVPTLVIADTDADGLWTPENARYVASKIPGARLVEFSRGFAMLPWWGEADQIVSEIGRFVAEIGEEEASFDRVLATVLFTDIVGSTSRVAELGDRGWRALVEQHHATVRALLARYRGVEVDTAGDGFFATFDGPIRAIKCAQAIRDAMEPLGLEVRAGLHTGECEKINGKIGGLGVVIGARVGATPVHPRCSSPRR